MRRLWQTLTDIVNIALIADDTNPKSKWNLGKIIDVTKGRDGIIRKYKIRDNNRYTIKRLLQLIRDLKIEAGSNKIDRAPTETDEQVR